MWTLRNRLCGGAVIANAASIHLDALVVQLLFKSSSLVVVLNLYCPHDRDVGLDLNAAVDEVVGRRHALRHRRRVHVCRAEQEVGRREYVNFLRSAKVYLLAEWLLGVRAE